MDGVGGLGGWRWIFILEGIFTVLIGVSVPWVLPDSPDSAKFLTQAERDIVNYRLAHDSGTSAGRVGTKEKFQWKYLWEVLVDPKIYLGVVMFWGNR
jgi:hypothetical protein